MSDFVHHILALLLRYAAGRLNKGGQFVTRDTLTTELLELVYEGLRSPSFLRVLNDVVGEHESANRHIGS